MSHAALASTLASAPVHWERRRFRFAAQLRTTKNSTASLPLLSVSAAHGVRVRGERGLGRQAPTEGAISSYWAVEPGDVVVNPMWVIEGGVAASNLRGAVSPAYRVYTPATDVDSRYLHHLLRSRPYMEQYRQFIRGVTTFDRSVSKEDFANLPMLLPPLEEQRRIADFLDVETSKLARIELLSSRLSHLLGERQASLLSKCFSSSTTETDGALPVKFALRRVVSRWIDYRGATPEKTVSGVPLVTAKNIRDGKIDMTASREYIAEDAYSDWMRRGLLLNGDVLLTTEAPLGQVAMVNDPGVALAQRVIVLRVDQRFCTPEWLYWYLRSPQGQAELELRATGSTALGIKADRLRGVPIPVLARAEAKERLAQLQRQVSQIESLQGELSRQRALIAERRQALTTAAVTGQFDVSTASGRNVTDGVTA